jgi:uroporphyrinogen-III synthase
MEANLASPKSVLVVRPLRQQDKFLQLLEQAQIDYQYRPIMRIQPIVQGEPQAEQIKNLILRFAEFDQAIFISANAAELAIAWLDQYWPMLPADMEYFAVGQQTAEILGQYGCQALTPQQQNTEGLLQEMPQLKNLQNKSVIIFRGGAGRTTLGETLENRGASVSYCELYQRIIDPDRLLEAKALLPEISCIVAHSGELLQALGNANSSTATLVVPSQRVAEMARNLNYKNIHVAENALPESMFKAVQIALAQSVF